MAKPFVDAIASSGEPGAMTALLAIDAMDHGALGHHAYRLALDVGSYSVPSWIPLVGHADVVRAVAAESEDGDVLFIEARRGGDDVHTVATYIDHRLGGAAKQLGLLWAARHRRSTSCSRAIALSGIEAPRSSPSSGRSTRARRARDCFLGSR